MFSEKEATAVKVDHTGHRQRMKNKLLKNGVSSLSEVELLEMLLYYAVPRADTRPTAEALMKRFGSLENVLSADIGELKKHSNLKENAEVLFTLLRELASRMDTDDAAPELADREGIKKYLVRLYRNLDVEVVYALHYNTAGAFVGKQMVFSGNINSARFSLRAVTEGVIRAGGKTVILVHNHPSKSVVPSEDDIISTRRIGAHLSANEIDLAEHFIVGGDQCVGVLKPD